MTSFDWRTYHSLRLGFNNLKIKAVLLNRRDQEATGDRELGITLPASSNGNAIIDATGVCIL